MKEAGAGVQFGALDALENLRSAAAAADGVIHLAFQHAFPDFAGALAIDLLAVEAMGTALEGAGKPFVIIAHFNGEASENVAIALAQRGVRTSIVQLPIRARRGRQGLRAETDPHRPNEGRV